MSQDLSSKSTSSLSSMSTVAVTTSVSQDVACSTRIWKPNAEREVIVNKETGQVASVWRIDPGYFAIFLNTRVDEG